MGGWISTITNLIALILLYQTGPSYLFIFTILITLSCFWTTGIMHNYAFSSAKARRKDKIEFMKRQGYTEKKITTFNDIPIQISPQDASIVPDKLAFTNMIVSILGYILFLIAIYLKYIK